MNINTPDDIIHELNSNWKDTAGLDYEIPIPNDIRKDSKKIFEIREEFMNDVYMKMQKNVKVLIVSPREAAIKIFTGDNPNVTILNPNLQMATIRGLTAQLVFIETYSRIKNEKFDNKIIAPFHMNATIIKFI